MLCFCRLWQERLNDDDEHFQQYQQSKGDANITKGCH